MLFRRSLITGWTTYSMPTLTYYSWSRLRGSTAVNIFFIFRTMLLIIKTARFGIGSVIIGSGLRLLIYRPIHRSLMRRNLYGNTQEKAEHTINILETKTKLLQQLQGFLMLCKVIQIRLEAIYSLLLTSMSL